MRSADVFGDGIRRGQRKQRRRLSVGWPPRPSACGPNARCRIANWGRVSGHEGLDETSHSLENMDGRGRPSYGKVKGAKGAKKSKRARVLNGCEAGSMLALTESFDGREKYSILFAAWHLDLGNPFKCEGRGQRKQRSRPSVGWPPRPTARGHAVRVSRIGSGVRSQIAKRRGEILRGLGNMDD